MKNFWPILSVGIFLITAACQPVATANQAALVLSPTPAFQARSTATAAVIPPVKTPVEVKVEEIPLAGPAMDPNAELSGLAWYGNWLVHLPQYPHRFSAGPDGAFLAISKPEILAYLDGKSNTPITPLQIPLIAPGIRDLPGYEGFESIGFIDNSLYLTIEASPGSMLAYLVKGDVIGGLAEIRLDPKITAKITPKVNISNLSDEALVILGDKIATF